LKQYGFFVPLVKTKSPVEPGEGKKPWKVKSESRRSGKKASLFSSRENVIKGNTQKPKNHSKPYKLILPAAGQVVQGYFSVPQRGIILTDFSENGTKPQLTSGSN
jgi:hypothetical protein